MANTKSAEKRHRQSLKRRARNVTVRGEVKTAVKSAREALGSKDGAQLTDAIKSAAKALDKAASKGVLHKRTASRRISRLAKAATKAARAKA
ncbi:MULTISPECIES: 30S ribosomal protein S20 [Myxococcus]|uniref:30S ribosomal protein S20 n=1 Tax=Myxococcus TaxID=32 RepID=UPI0011428177|nr:MULTISPECIES: 30S ribosomal protein S20 [Myxococcus]NOK01029.1 30S ribosomal protein S20 [Myxococcus xanthus]